MQLQTIRFPAKSICSEEELYFHKRDNWIDFNGYFNLFYIEKRKKYSQLIGLRLKLRIKGAIAIRLMHDREILAERNLDASDQGREYTLEFPYNNYETGVFWFSLKFSENNRFQKSGTSASLETLVNGFFDGILKEPTPTSIATVICTYKREDYVCRNLQSLKQIFENQSLEVESHLQVFLVDNGQTLDKNEEIQQLKRQCNGKVLVFSNPNAGGAGGFTRGMLEALSRKETDGLTHVLLMDDDAIFEPDLFVRLYGFLASLKEDFRTVTVGGNLMREDFPYLLHASGERFFNFKIYNDHILTDLRKFETCISDFLCCTKNQPWLYSGWWCCCYSMETVRENNLPIPLFLHHDDIEYGLRNYGQGIVFLNGIDVWHRGAETVFTGSTRYYDVRNALITTALHQPNSSRFTVKKWVWRNIIVAILEFRYGEAHLAYQGLVDFCKGPNWLFSQDPEALNQRVRNRFSLKPLAELSAQVSKEQYGEICRQIHQYEDQFEVEQIRQFYAPSRHKGHLLKKALWNGWLLPGKQRKRRKLPVIAASDTPYKAFREQRIVIFEPFKGTALITERSYKEFKSILKCLVQTNMLVDRFYLKAAKEYREKLNEITSASAWEKYLGLKITNNDNKG